MGYIYGNSLSLAQSVPKKTNKFATKQQRRLREIKEL